MGNDCWKAGNAKAAGDPTLPRYGTDLVQVRSRLLRRKTNASYLDEVSTVTAVASGRKDERVVLGRGQYRNAVASGRCDLTQVRFPQRD